MNLALEEKFRIETQKLHSAVHGEKMGSLYLFLSPCDQNAHHLPFWKSSHWPRQAFLGALSSSKVGVSCTHLYSSPLLKCSIRFGK